MMFAFHILLVLAAGARIVAGLALAVPGSASPELVERIAVPAACSAKGTSEVYKILSLLRASSFCSSFIHLQTSTVHTTTTPSITITVTGATVTPTITVPITTTTTTTLLTTQTVSSTVVAPTVTSTTPT